MAFAARLLTVSLSVLVLLICAAGAGAVGAGGAAGGGAAGETPRAQLEEFVCGRAMDPADRSVSVQAVMRPLPGTHSLALRLELLQRVGARQATGVVRAGDLGVWISPRPANLGQRPGDVWRLRKTVLNLAAPAGYEFRVSFRWTGARGRVIGRASRTTRTCRQPELRPDPLVRSPVVAPAPGDPRHDVYTVVVANQGATGAGPFVVLFAPGDSSAPSTDTIGYLGAGQSRQLSFTGPLCDAGAPPTVTVDAARQVDDLNRANDLATATCPSP